jgi:hypothetical protein
MGSRHAPVAALAQPLETQELVQIELRQILQSPEFRQSEQCKRLLRYLVEHSLQGNLEQIKERAIGIAVFGRESGYDTNETPVVRVRANEIRKRLAKYSQHAAGAPVRLEIPPGGYRVEFHLAGQEEAVASVVQDETGSPAAHTSARSRWIYAAVGVLAIAALGISFRNVGGPVDALIAFWEPALESSSPVILCSGHPVLYRFTPAFRDKIRGSPANNFQSQTEVLRLLPDQVLHGSDIVALPDQYVGLGSAEAIANIDAWLARRQKDAIIRYGNDLSFAELRLAPAVVVGAFQNRWTMEFTRGLRFVFASEGLIPVVRDMQTGKVWTPAQLQKDGHTSDDYVVISRVLKSASGEFVVAAAGITQYGCQAAAEVLTQPQLMKDAARVLRPGWEKHNLQLFYHVNVVGGTSGPPELLAAHGW